MKAFKNVTSIQDLIDMGVPMMPKFSTASVSDDSPSQLLQFGLTYSGMTKFQESAYEFLDDIESFEDQNKAIEFDLRHLKKL